MPPCSRPASRSTTPSSGTFSRSSSPWNRTAPYRPSAFWPQSLALRPHHGPAGAARAGGGGTAGPPPGLGHVRRGTEDDVAAASDELYRAGGREWVTASTQLISAERDPGRSRMSPSGSRLSLERRCSASNGCVSPTSGRWRWRQPICPLQDSPSSRGTFVAPMAVRRSGLCIRRRAGQCEESIATAPASPPRSRPAAHRHRSADARARPAIVRRVGAGRGVGVELVSGRSCHVRCQLDRATSMTNAVAAVLAWRTAAGLAVAP